MAEIAIGVAKDKLVSLLIAEAKLLKDVDIEVTEIASQLEVIQTLLKDADKRAEEEGDNIRDGVKAWVQELREIAFQIEDLVTEYTHHVVEQPPDCHGRFEECLKEIASFLVFCCSKLIQRHVLALKIRMIKPRFAKIKERGLKDGFIDSIQEGSTTRTTRNVVPSYDPRDFSRDIQEDELVGIGSARDGLVDALLDDSSQCTIIPVVGMGGLGKTTLTQNVYNHVKARFQCHAWLDVPRAYTREDILRSLLMELFKSTEESIPGEIHKMDAKELKDKLRGYLKGKKYLVIFDDVWKVDFWGDIGHSLVDDKVGARVMITTRKMQVVEFCQSLLADVRTHKMQRLGKKNSWELFCKKTFKAEGGCPEELQKISGDIVERCEGLPLAIVVIAGLLSAKKKTINEWRRFHSSLRAELENTVQLKSIKKILSLSYYELPYNLKACLLYFGMFPRGRSIRNGRLIRQWIAEGFVNAVEGKTLEEVAQEYMNELINRSLVEASELDSTGKPKKCRVHDFLHGIILMKTQEVRFSQVLPASGTDQLKLGRIARRLSIILNNSSNDVLRIIAFSHSSAIFSHVHSVVTICEDETLNLFVPVFAINFKFIKVLDFEDALHLDHLPEDIGNLFDLRYLSVRGTKVSILPMSVAKLENLETLDLRKSFVCEIPTGIIKMLCKLRHLFGFKWQPGAPFKSVGIKMVGGIGGLKALQKLYHIEADGDEVDSLFKELGNLTQLKTLGIWKLRREDGVLLCICLEKMRLLESLIVYSRNENEFVDFECMSSPPQFLRNLNLRGRLHKLPECFKLLENLVKLRLSCSMLEDDPLEVLQKMLNLLALTIDFNAYVGEKLHFKEGMFLKLKKLYFVQLPRLSSLIIEETALPMLEVLYIARCPQMKELPSGLQHLQYLKTLEFHSVPQEFLLQDFQSIDHVAHVHFCFENKEGQNRWVRLPVLRQWQERLRKELQEAQDGASTSKSTI